VKTRGRNFGLLLKLDGRLKPVMHYSAYTRVEQG
jgi:hypothetical protein